MNFSNNYTANIRKVIEINRNIFLNNVKKLNFCV